MRCREGGWTLRTLYHNIQWIGKAVFPAGDALLYNVVKLFCFLVPFRTSTVSSSPTGLSVSLWCGLSVSLSSDTHLWCCVWIHTSGHTREYVHTCNTWSPTDWKHSAVSNDLTKVLTFSELHSCGSSGSTLPSPVSCLSWSLSSCPFLPSQKRARCCLLWIDKTRAKD